ncbi:LysR family transcriptional regulator [Nonomuraea sp. M3C6]|uniref:LysR family transcriptional regulator n=1 Tax=Nonomuraea marmarensis TaxID=3351344 RepID=A0ABW7APX4_9ACTN
MKAASAFTGASRKLNRSQPAISRRIRELEQSLGAVLFERTGRRVLLTGQGAPAARRLPDLRVLQDERWLGFPPERGQPDSFGHLLERQLPACGLVDPSITHIDSLTAQKRLVQAGLGVALMPTTGQLCIRHFVSRAGCSNRTQLEHDHPQSGDAARLR